MSILIVGAGATGGYFGGRLAQAGREVTFLVRERRAAQLRERGLRIIGPDGTDTVQPRTVTADQLREPAEVVLVTVKAAGLEAVIGQVTPAVGPATAVIPVLNGLRHMGTLSAAFGAGRVLGGVATLSTHLDENGDIRQFMPRASLRAGAQDGARTPVAGRAGELLADAGFDFGLSDSITAEMWSKWAFIAAAGAVSCLLGGAVGQVTAVGLGTEVARAIIAETQAVARAAGYPVPPAVDGQMTAVLTAQGSGFTPSMYRDMRAGAPVEVETILGDLVTAARKHGAVTPLLDAATVALRVYQAGRTA